MTIGGVVTVPVALSARNSLKTKTRLGLCPHYVGRIITEIGTLKDIGFKHGRWLDTVLLQMKPGEGNSTLPEDSDLML
jgi:hypothetical protein